MSIEETIAENYHPDFPVKECDKEDPLIGELEAITCFVKTFKVLEMSYKAKRVLIGLLQDSL